MGKSLKIPKCKLKKSWVFDTLKQDKNKKYFIVDENDIITKELLKRWN